MPEQVVRVSAGPVRDAVAHPGRELLRPGRDGGLRGGRADRGEVGEVEVDRLDVRPRDALPDGVRRADGAFRVSGGEDDPVPLGGQALGRALRKLR